MATKEMTKTGETAAREPKPVKPTDVAIQESGFAYKVVVVEMSDDVTFDDVGNKPELWTNIQADRTGKALVEDDKVELRWIDKRVYATVDYADHKGVSFIDIRQVKKKDRDREPFNDGTFAVRWVSEGGYSYLRLPDGVRMTNATYPTWEAAKAALIREQ